jgi:hypothetical protein
MEKEEAHDYLRHLLQTEDINRLPIEDAVRSTADLVELSSYFDNADGTVRARQWCDALLKGDLTPGQRSQLNFYNANAWDDERQRKHKGEAYNLDWEQVELRHQILSLRRAVDSEGLSELPPVERAMILTNLANQLNAAGRVVDAVEVWNQALIRKPNFAMALGNRGQGWYYYAHAYYDDGHRQVMCYRAYQSLSAALAADADWSSAPPGAKKHFAKLRAHIHKFADVEHLAQNLKLDGHGLGRSQVERSYRRWCLSNCLFLNPLNDLGPHDIAAQDVLTLPTYRTPITEGPTLIGFFNQMKQEFVSARWLLYDGSHTSKRHFSDGNVKLHNTNDYPSYSLSVEKVKLAFRSAYSLLDKIAFFLNDYLELRIPERAVSFHSIWFEKRDKKTLRTDFQDSANWPLRGLYWLAKDFVDEDFRSSTAPDARDFYDIRNHLEHKYLKVRLMEPPEPAATPREADEIRYDRLAKSIGRSDLEANTLRLFKLARAALVYMCLAMQDEERQRVKRKPDDPNKIGPIPMQLDIWDDRWKF